MPSGSEGASWGVWLGRGDQTGGSKNATEIWLAARGSRFVSMVFDCFELFYCSSNLEQIGFWT